jgi:hypothetical protein
MAVPLGKTKHRGRKERRNPRADLKVGHYTPKNPPSKTEVGHAAARETQYVG